MLLSCLRGLDVAYILSVCKGKAFGWFPQVFWLFSLPERRFFVLRSGLGWVFESNDVYVGAFCPTKRTALRSLMQRAAMAVAVRCGGWCSALRHPLLVPLGRAAGRLLCGFFQASSFFLRAWAGCKRCWMPPAGGLRGGSLRSARPENVKREGCLDGIPSRLLLYLVWLACLCARRFGWSISPSKVSPNARVRL